MKNVVKGFPDPADGFRLLARPDMGIALNMERLDHPPGNKVGRERMSRCA
jgi:hypothetical protein